MERREQKMIIHFIEIMDRREIGAPPLDIEYMDLSMLVRWYCALMSGEYPQGRNKLGNEQDGFCCLGVAYDLCTRAGDIRASWTKEGGFSRSEDSYMPEVLSVRLGMGRLGDPSLGYVRSTEHDEGYYTLTASQANDGECLSFPQIAQLLHAEIVRRVNEGETE